MEELHMTGRGLLTITTGILVLSSLTVNFINFLLDLIIL